MKEISSVQQSNFNPFVRLFFMAVLYVLFIVVRALVIVVAVFQFFSHLLTGRGTQFGKRFGLALARWIYDVMLFLTYNTDQMPFPFKGVGSDEP